jgi:hypothetical protein
LLVNQVISVSDLKQALSYLDQFLYLPYTKKPGFNREMARQLTLAASLTLITIDILGEDANLSNIPIYQRGATITISSLEDIILDIQLKKSLLEQKNIPNTSSETTRNLLQDSLMKMIEYDECQSSLPLPKNPPREVRTVERYFWLPFAK